MKRLLVILLRTAALVYVGLLALLAVLQRRLIYFPGRSPFPEDRLALVAREQGLEPWRDAAGARIGWRQLPPGSGPAQNRMLVFHGNAGTAFDRENYARGFGRLAQGALWQVYLFEYPGYDTRPGSPGEESFRSAGRAAILQLAAEDRRPIYLTGESLGSGLAAALAGEMPDKISGIFFKTPFASLRDVATLHYPWLPVGLVLRDRWENLPPLRNFHGPIAVLLAGRDEVVTTAQGQKLFDAYAGPKKRWIDEDGGHNTVSDAPWLPWWGEVSDFLLSTRAQPTSPDRGRSRP